MPVIKGWKFPIQVDEVTGKIKTVEDNENIKQSVRVILETQKYERKIFPNFGTDLRSYMFEVVDPNFISRLRKSIETSLKMWESHIEDLNVAVNASSGPVSKVEVAIDYITDIEPTQERVKKRIDANDI
jgi:phage baseplate assembly protein W